MNNPPLNRCVYCLRNPGSRKEPRDVPKGKPELLRQGDLLTVADFGAEHVFPQGLLPAGQDGYTIPKGSCWACGQITGNEIEEVCIRDMLWVGRSLTGHKSGLRLPDSDALGLLPVYLPPTMFKGPYEPQHETFKIYGMSGDLSELRTQAHELRPSKFVLNLPIMARFLAKIAHGLCVKRYGFEGFVPFLPEIILGERPDYWTFVGGTEDPVEPTGSYVMQTGHIPIPQYPGPEFIQVLIRFFADMGDTPTYRVIAGRLPGFRTPAAPDSYWKADAPRPSRRSLGLASPSLPKGLPNFLGLAGRRAGSRS